jgi:hypothetical protein
MKFHFTRSSSDSDPSGDRSSSVRLVTATENLNVTQFILQQKMLQLWTCTSRIQEDINQYMYLRNIMENWLLRRFQKRWINLFFASITRTYETYFRNFNAEMYSIGAQFASGRRKLQVTKQVALYPFNEVPTLCITFLCQDTSTYNPSAEHRSILRDANPEVAAWSPLRFIMGPQHCRFSPMVKIKEFYDAPDEPHRGEYYRMVVQPNYRSHRHTAKLYQMCYGADSTLGYNSWIWHEIDGYGGLVLELEAGVDRLELEMVTFMVNLSLALQELLDREQVMQILS